MSATQDMPPPGGFSTINVGRTFARPLVKQGLWYLLGMAMSFNGLYVVTEFRKRRAVLKTEQIEHYVAAHPFVLVEQERDFLRHLRALREEERELMKDHPGWKLGTLYGEPVYKTIPKNEIPPISPQEWIVHRPTEEFYKRVITPDLHQ